MRQWTRRDLFKRVACAAAAGCTSLARPRPALAIPPINRTRPGHLKLSIAAYSYRDHLTGKKSPNLDLFDMTEADLIPECAGLMGSAAMIAQIMEEDCRVLTY